MYVTLQIYADVFVPEKNREMEGKVKEGGGEEKTGGWGKRKKRRCLLERACFIS